MCDYMQTERKKGSDTLQLSKKFKAEFSQSDFSSKTLENSGQS